MTNAYVTLERFKAGLKLELTDNDTLLLATLENESRLVDAFCRRWFYSLTQTREISGNGKDELLLPHDLIAVVTLKEDEAGDGAYSTTWEAADYALWPFDADPTGGHDRSMPYLTLQVSKRSTGTKSVFTAGQREFQLAARWGYWERTEAVATTVNGAHTDSATSLVVVDGTKVEAGMTLLIGSEQLYVTAIATNTLTVERGVNGTTAAAISDGATISRYRYPAAIEQAVTMQASRIWTRRASGFANQVGFTESGQITPVQGLDKDVQQHIRSYVRM